MGAVQSLPPQPLQAPTEEEELLTELYLLFDALDTDRDESLSNDELLAFFSRNGSPVMNSQTIEALRKRYCLGGKRSEIGWTREEFREVFFDAKKMFRLLDRDRNGYVTPEELASHLAEQGIDVDLLMRRFDHDGLLAGEGVDVNKLIRRFDISNDGKLDFLDFFLLYDLAAKERLDELLDYWQNSMTCWSDSPFVIRPASVIASLIFGAFSGAVGRTVTAPISRMGILTQVSTGKEKESALSMCRRIYRHEGLGGMYRGNLATVLKIGPSVAVSLTVFDVFRDYLDKRKVLGHWFNISGSALDRTNHFVAGAASGVISLTLTYPLDFIRTRLSMEGPGSSRTIRDAIRDVGGPRNLFRGLGLATIEVIPQSGLRFFFLSVTRDLLGKGLVKNDMGVIVGASIVAGVASQLATYPLALVRRTQQSSTSPESAWQSTRRVYQSSGFRGFYRGAGLNLMQVVPSVAVSFGVYEYCKKVFQV